MFLGTGLNEKKLAVCINWNTDVLGRGEVGSSVRISVETESGELRETSEERLFWPAEGPVRPSAGPKSLS